MKTATVNIIVSLDYDLMQEFQNKESLADFKTKLLELKRSGEIVSTGFYENTINDSLISLNHTMGNEGTKMEIEFVDPHEKFEKGHLAPFSAGFFFDNNPLLQMGGEDPAMVLLREKWATYQRSSAIVKITKYGIGTLLDGAMSDMMRAAVDLAGVAPFLSDGMLSAGSSNRTDWLKSVGMKNGTTEKLFIAGLQDLKDTLRDEIKEITGYSAYGLDPDNLTQPPSDDIDGAEMGRINNTVIQLLQQKAGLKLQAPVWIAYGIGDDIKRDWSKPTTYGMVAGAEYGFTGDGARIIKLSFGGVGGVGSALGRLGLSPLGAGTAGIGPTMLITGGSQRLFNLETQTSLTNALAVDLRALEEGETQSGVPKALRIISPPTFTAGAMSMRASWADRKAQEAMTVNMPMAPTFTGLSRFGIAGRSWRSPSFHVAIKTAMKNYIKACLPVKYKKNVVVLMPNLDPALEQAARDHWSGLPMNSYEGYSYQSDERNVSLLSCAWLKAYSIVIEKCGLVFGRGWAFDGAGTGMFYNPIGNSTWFQQKNFTTSRHIGDDWFQNQVFKVICESDFTTEVPDKLDTVGEGLRSALADSPDQNNIPPISMKLYLEEDSELLKVMAKHKIIEDPSIPAVIWGDTTMRDKYLEARSLESLNLDSAGEFSDFSNPETNREFIAGMRDLHACDIAEGITSAYMKDLIDIIIPPPHDGPFGFTGRVEGSDEYFLSPTESVTTNEKSNLSHRRMAVFSFGTKNPNITKVKFDIDNQYTSLLHFTHGMTLGNNQTLINSILSPNVNHIVAQDFFEDFKQWKTTSEVTLGGEIPQGFKNYMEPYLYAKAYTQGGVIRDSFDDWEEVFNRFAGATGNDPLAAAKENMVSQAFSYESTVAKRFYEGMWNAFTSLYDEVGVPYLRFKGRNTAGASVRTAQEIKERLTKLAVVGKITTLPRFQLCNHRKVMNRPCLVFAREPGSNPIQGERTETATWFTGLYTMYGFEHRISAEEVSSEFYVTRDTLSGFLINRNEDDGSPASTPPVIGPQ